MILTCHESFGHAARNPLDQSDWFSQFSHLAFPFISYPMKPTYPRISLLTIDWMDCLSVHLSICLCLYFPSEGWWHIHSTIWQHTSLPGLPGDPRDQHTHQISLLSLSRHRVFLPFQRTLPSTQCNPRPIVGAMSRSTSSQERPHPFDNAQNDQNGYCVSHCRVRCVCDSVPCQCCWDNMWIWI